MATVEVNNPAIAGGVEIVREVPVPTKATGDPQVLGWLVFVVGSTCLGLELVGFDISQHGLASARPDLKASLFRYRAQDPYPFGDNYFDLVISLTAGS